MTKSELIALLTYVYTRGYRHGHESSVDGSYIDVNRVDYETWHSDIVVEIVDEEPERFAHISQPQPVAQGDSYESGWDDGYKQAEWDAQQCKPAKAVAQGEAVAVVKVEDDNGFERIVHMEHSLKPGTHHLYKAPTIPTGHRVVPVEPTEEMVRAYLDCQDAAPDDPYEAEVYYGYKAMIAAAPDAGGV